MHMIVLTRRTVKAMSVVEAEIGGKRALTLRVLGNTKQRVMYFIKLMVARRGFAGNN